MAHTFFIALTAILSVLCVIGFAILMRRTGRIGPEVDKPVFRLVMDLLFPCLIFDKIIKTDAFAEVQNLWLPPLIGFAMTAVALLIGFAVSRLPSSKTGLTTAKQKRTFAACVSLINYGYVPIPLAAALFPNDNRTMGVLFPMYLGAEISVWTLVIFTMLGKIDSKSWKHLINGPILAIILTVPLNLLINASFFPSSFFVHCKPGIEFFLAAVHQLGQAAIPVSLLMVGFTISELIHFEEIKSRLKTSAKTAFWSCIVRLLIMSALVITAAVFLPCTLEIKRIMVIYGAMGAAILPIVLSKHYNGNPQTAFDTVVSSMLLSVIVLPFWIATGLKLINS
ncbi:MAG: AEC family transporter [Planctomycetaceae bacterium]|nr:AEC family transporter [Planctomycetaceae bacterium]